MKLTTFVLSVAALSSSISTSNAAPAPEAGPIEGRRAIPFKINVSSPFRQTLVPEYTLCNGHITSIAADAARYYFSDTSPLGLLYCSDPKTSGQMGFTKTLHDFAVVTDYVGTKAYRDRFSLGEDKKLAFYNKALGKARWVLRGGTGGDQIDADFGGFTTQDFIVVTLTAQF